MASYNLIVLALEAAAYFLVLVTLLHHRRRIGLGVFFTVLGTMHFLETYLAAKFYIDVPFGSISPGSAMMFSGKLLMILLLYIKEDATTVRPVIYGLLVGNFVCLMFGFTLGLHAGNGQGGYALAENDFLREMGILMVWGTTLLYVDSLAVILLYERLGRWLGRALLPRFLIAGIATLAFDQIGFYGALSYLYGAPIAVFWAGLFAKISMAVVYTALTGIYVAFFSEERMARPRGLTDVFNDLTYREKYTDLLSRSGVDALTGLADRSRLEQDGVSLLRDAMRSGVAFSVMVIDADHFKQINDTHGHLEGDVVLKQIVARLRNGIRSADRLYRFGGEEFVVLSVGGDHAEAMAMAERLRISVFASVKADGNKSVSVSIGVATAPMDGTSLMDLIAAADRNLYIAKEEGRNQVRGRS